MNFEQKVAEITNLLAELDTDIETLQGNIKAVRDFMAGNPTEDECKANSGIFDVEKGLKHIELY